MFEFFEVKECDIRDYVCHFRFDDRFFTLTGFITGNDSVGYRVFLSKKSDFNTYNVKAAVMEHFSKHYGLNIKEAF